MNWHLVVMVKAPRIGQVKTRLGRDIGCLKAWVFYRRMLCRVVGPLARNERWTMSLAVTPDSTLYKNRIWPLQTRRIAQGRGDLGKRMHRVFTAMPPGPVVIIGADIPGIRSAHIRHAFRALGPHDAVIGPAEDGGYWLIGLRRRPALKDIFSGVRWSTVHALADTESNLPVHWRIAVLETLTDVDDSGTYSALKQIKVK